MKINAIQSQSFTHSMDCGCCKPKPQNISFGFGEDYGPDPSVDPDFSRGAKNPNAMRSLWMLVEMPVAIIKDALQDQLELYKEERKYKERLKRTGRLEETPVVPKTDEIAEIKDVDELKEFNTVA